MQWEVPSQIGNKKDPPPIYIHICTCIPHTVNISLVHNLNANDDVNECNLSFTQHVLLCSGSVYEGTSRPIKHSHSHRSLHAVIHFVVVAACTCILIYESTTMSGFSVRWNIRIQTNLLPAVIHVVTFAVHIQTYGSTSMLILCFQYLFVAFAFISRIMYKWNFNIKRMWVW